MADCAGCEGRQAEIRTLEMQVGALENIIALQNGAMDEIGRLMSALPAGLVAKTCHILERHGVKVPRPQKPLQ